MAFDPFERNGGAGPGRGGLSGELGRGGRCVRRGPWFLFLPVLLAAASVAAGGEDRRALPSGEPPSIARFLGRDYSDDPVYLAAFARPHPTPRELHSRLSLKRPAEIPSSRIETIPGIGIRSTLPAGLIPTAVAAADFDSDGRLDFVVASGWEDSLWFYRGKGNGEFHLPRILPLKGNSPLSVEAVDLRSNGKVDLVVCHTDSRTIGVLLGNGDGTFAEEAAYPVGGKCGTTVTADFNGDGHLDIAVAFLRPWGADPGALASDGYDSTTGVGVLFATGGGRFAPIRYAKPESQVPSYGVLLAADLDGDGFLDLVASPFGNTGCIERVAMFRNDGRGGFHEAQTLIWSSNLNPITSVVSGDINRDGCPDLVLAFATGGIQRLVNRCDGSFELQERWNFGGQRAWGGLLADVDGDGISDLVLIGSRLSVMKGDGAGGFGRARTFRGEFGLAVAAGDFDNDGRLDLVSVNQWSESITLFRNEGGGFFGNPSGFGAIDPGTSDRAGFSQPMFGDFNRDGATDILFIQAEGAHAAASCRISVLTVGADHRLHGVMRSETQCEPIFGDFALADFRNLGRLDLLMVGQFELFSPGGPFLGFAPEGGDGTFGPTRLTFPQDAGGLLAVADFNRDGFLDFATAGNFLETGHSSHRITLFLGQGDGSFTPRPKITFGRSSLVSGREALWPGGLHAGDFNADGNPDLLLWVYEGTVPQQGHALWQLLGRGDGTFSPPRKLYDHFRSFSVTDLNGDGLLDLITAKDAMTDYPEPTKPEFEIFLGRADGIFHKGATYQPFSGLSETRHFRDRYLGVWYDYSPRIGDFNGDGRIDIAVLPSTRAGGGDTLVRILAGNGDGTFTELQNIYRLGHTPPGYVADLDGDGFSDFIDFHFWGSIDVLWGEPGPPFQLELLNPRVDGTRGYGLIRLAVPSAGTTILQLSSSSPEVKLPASVSLPAGATEKVFTYSIEASHDWRRVFTVSATHGRHTATGYAWQKAPDVLYLPHLGDGTSEAQRLRTSFIFVNTGDDARVRLELFDSDHRPLVVALEDGGADSVFALSLPRGEAVSLESTGLGPLKVGYGRVTVFGSVGGTAVFTGIDVSTGVVLYEAGVPLTETFGEATVMLDSLGMRNTGLALVNTASGDPETTLYYGDAEPTLRLYDASYRLLDEKTSRLAAGEHRARFMTEVFDGPAAAGMTGTATLESEMPLALLTLRQTYDSRRPFPRSVPTLTAFPVAPGRAERITDTQSLFAPWSYLPQFADGEGGGRRFHTSLFLANPGIDSGVNIRLYDSDGSPMEAAFEGLGTNSRFFVFLRRGESVQLRSSGTGPMRVGHVRVQALRKVVGTAIYTGIDSQTGVVLYEAGLPLAKPLRQFSVFVDSLGTRNTGVALANGQDGTTQGARVRLGLYDLRFQLLAEKEIQLPWNSHLARYVDELFPEVPQASEMQGVLTVTSDVPLTAATLRTNDDPRLEFPRKVPTLTTFPVVPGVAD